MHDARIKGGLLEQAADKSRTTTSDACTLADNLHM